MPKVTVDENLCKGCELCVTACPRGCLQLDKSRLNAKGYHPSSMIKEKEGDCVGCAMCAMMCPDVAIKVER